MKTFIVLLRGINVGGNNILPMKELVSLLEKNNYQKVTTYIQSGNVVLQSEERPVNMRSLIESKFGFKPDILILNTKEFLKASKHNPFEDAIGNQLHFLFCKDLPSPDLSKIDALKSSTEEYCIIDKVVYLHAPEGIGRSKLSANFEKCLGVSATGRNLNTVNKLIEMIGKTE